MKDDSYNELNRLKVQHLVHQHLVHQHISASRPQHFVLSTSFSASRPQHLVLSTSSSALRSQHLVLSTSFSAFRSQHLVFSISFSASSTSTTFSSSTSRLSTSRTSVESGFLSDFHVKKHFHLIFLIATEDQDKIVLFLKRFRLVEVNLNEHRKASINYQN